MAESVAILPARGGSRRIPRKSIRRFHGRPTIGWPIAPGRATRVGRSMISTDDAEIAEVSRAQGAEVPFLRDAKLADDRTGMTAVIRDAVLRLGLAEAGPVCCLHPAALLVSADGVAGRARLDAGADRVLSVGRYATPADGACRLAGDRLVPRAPAMMPRRSKDPEPTFFDAGQVCRARAEALFAAARA